MEGRPELSNIIKRELEKQYPNGHRQTPAQRIWKQSKARSEAEERFMFQVTNSGLPIPEREQMLIPGRQWRYDFVWRDKKIIFEIEGGTWTNGRHSRAKGFENDIYKYEAARKLGYSVFRYTTRMVSDGEALLDAQELLS